MDLPQGQRARLPHSRASRRTEQDGLLMSVKSTRTPRLLGLDKTGDIVVRHDVVSRTLRRPGPCCYSVRNSLAAVSLRARITYYRLNPVMSSQRRGWALGSKVLAPKVTCSASAPYGAAKPN